MSDWINALGERLSKYSEAEFEYDDTRNIEEAKQIDYGVSGIYMEATVIFFEIKNLTFILKEHGRRKAAQLYTMCNVALSTICKRDGAFVNCFSPGSFLIVYPGKEEQQSDAIRGALRIVQALSDTFKHQFSIVPGAEFSMGIDHGHIMGTKNPSDCGFESLTWFGTCIYKAMRIAQECARPFYVGISGSIYHSISEDLRIRERRILGIRKKVEIWTKISYQFDNVKKHLYQTNHKIQLDED